MIIVPSFSSSQASLLLSKIKIKLNEGEYLIIFSSVAISALFFSFFLAINFYKPRLGYIAILLSNNILGKNISNFCLGITLFLSLCLSILLIVFTYKKIIDVISKFNLKIVNIFLILFVFALVILLFGIKSIPLLILSTSIGFLPILFGVDRVILMSYIMIPTILFYI
jgi:TctA family transporter